MIRELTSQQEHTTPCWRLPNSRSPYPGDALFAPGEARLLATAPELLTSIFEDLNQYPNATILIGSHTDDRMEPSQSMSLAFSAGQCPEGPIWLGICQTIVGLPSAMAKANPLRITVPPNFGSVIAGLKLLLIAVSDILLRFAILAIAIDRRLATYCPVLPYWQLLLIAVSDLLPCLAILAIAIDRR